MEAAGPMTQPTRLPLRTRAPSGTRGRNRTAGSTRWNTRPVTGRPAVTSDSLAIIHPRALGETGRRRRVVRSPDPTSSARARRRWDRTEERSNLTPYSARRTLASRRGRRLRGIKTRERFGQFRPPLQQLPVNRLNPIYDIRGRPAHKGLVLELSPGGFQFALHFLDLPCEAPAFVSQVQSIGQGDGQLYPGDHSPRRQQCGGDLL